MNSKTLTIIKPVAVQKGFTGQILNKIFEAGFNIIALKMVKLSNEQAKDFYKIHKGKDFYNDLAKFMSSAPIVVAILEKENAVEEYRKLIGNTDPAKADDNSIRHLYGTSLRANAVHGSDSNESAEFECNFFFSQTERFLKKYHVVY